MNHQAEPQNPWKITQSREALDTPWVKVMHHEVINPAGQPGVYAITHFKNLAIGVIPIDDEGYTWLVGQWRFPINRFSWEIPEGGGKLNVPPLESAKRELLEEVGITAQDWKLILTMHLSNSATDEFAYIYLARNLTFGTPNPDEDEQLTQKRVHFDDLYAMVERGEITDSLTVAAALKVKLMMLQNEI